MENMNFGMAIEAMKKGHKVARKGWNGKGMMIYITGGKTVNYKDIHDENLIDAIDKREEAEQAKYRRESARYINAHIDMIASDGTIVVGWLASQTDMLSDDWNIVE